MPNQRQGAYEIPSWAIGITLYGRGARASRREETMKTWCVVYRIGGTDNYKWQRSLAFTDRTEVEAHLDEVQRMGYTAHIADYSQSISLGLPETYAP